MEARRLGATAAFLFVAAGLLTYAVTYQPARRAAAPTELAVRQQAFDVTRRINSAGTLLQETRFVSAGGDVEVSWYDSSLSALAPRTGSYVTLMIDGRRVVDALTGTYLGDVVKSPVSLLWAGPLPAGSHRIAIVVTRVDDGMDAPYVEPGHPGVDNLVVSQLGGGD